MSQHRVVSREDWITARRDLLAQEKELTCLRDRLSEARRELPWVRVDKAYVFDGPDGPETLSQVFAGRTQLIVYHFMCDPEWTEGCKSCSFWADNFNGIVVHLAHRDGTMVAVSKAPFDKSETFRRRMGWSVRWLSSFRTDFNHDYHVSFYPEELATGKIFYNFTPSEWSGSAEAPGISVFYRDADGSIYHTYSCYARGLDAVNGAYQLLDLVPKGRDEDDLPYGMVRHHDHYGADGPLQIAGGS